MSDYLNKKLEKQSEIIELLKEESRNTDQALVESAFYASLERDLDNAMLQMQMNYLEGRI